MTARTFRRAAVVPVQVSGLALLATALLALLATPAMAVDVAIGRDDGDAPGAGFSVFETLGWFVGAPLLLALVIALLVMGPSSARGPRYRPGLGWWAAPVWFNGPDRGKGAAGRSGAAASDPAASGDPSTRSTASTAPSLPAGTTTTAGGGGASARW